MTDVRKSRVTLTERSNTDAGCNRNIKKVKAAPEELHRASDDSSGDSSECESTSDTSESTAGSSKSRALLRRQQQQHRTVDCNDFEERAKRFLETMSVERRREWLRQQGYSFNEDGLLVPPTGAVGYKVNLTAGSFHRNRNRNRLARCERSEDDDDDDLTEESARGSPGRRGSGDGSTVDKRCSNSASQTSEDSDSASPSEEEEGSGGTSPDDPYDHAAEISDQYREGESPNAVIQNRHARLMSRIYSTEDGFPDIDMETMVIPEASSGVCECVGITDLNPEYVETERELRSGAQIDEAWNKDQCPRGNLNGEHQRDYTCLQPEPDGAGVNDVSDHRKGVMGVDLTRVSANIGSQWDKSDQTKTQCNDESLNSRLKEAYMPVVDDAIVTVLGEVPESLGVRDVNQRPSPKDALHPGPTDTGVTNNDGGVLSEVRYSSDAVSHSVNTATCHGVNTAACHGVTVNNQGNQAQGEDAYSCLVINTSVLLSEDRATDSRMGFQFHGEETGELRTRQQNGDSKDTRPPYLNVGEMNGQRPHTDNECFDKKEISVTPILLSRQAFHSEPNSADLVEITSLHSDTQQSDGHCHDNRNSQCVNDQCPQSTKLAEYVSTSHSPSMELSSSEQTRLAQLRKLVDKKLVRHTLNYSKLNSQKQDMKSAQNENYLSLADVRNKQPEDERKKSLPDFSCFVTGSKILVAEKLSSNRMSHPPTKVKMKALPTQSASGCIGNRSDQEKRKSSVSSAKQEQLKRSPANGSHQKLESGPMKETAIKGSQKSTIHVSVSNRSQENVHRDTVRLADESTVKKRVSGSGDIKSENLTTKGRDKDQKDNKPDCTLSKANKTPKTLNKYQNETIRAHLPAIKTTDPRQKYRTEPTEKEILKLPKIPSAAQRHQKTDLDKGRGDWKSPGSKMSEVKQARSRGDEDRSKNFLPPLSKATNSSQVKPSKIGVRPTGEKLAEKTKNEIDSHHELNKNNHRKENRGSNKSKNCNGNEGGPESKRILQGKLPEMGNGKQGSGENSDANIDTHTNIRSTCGARDTTVEKSYLQVEVEIQQEIEHQLKQVKQSKSTTASPNNCHPKPLSDKDKLSIKSKMDALDSLEDLDDIEENDFLSKIVSDSNITMYGHTKNTPLIRKTLPSSLDKTKERICGRKAGPQVKPCQNQRKESDNSQKLSYTEIKNKALSNAKQRVGQGDTRPTAGVRLNKSANAVVAGGEYGHDSKCSNRKKFDNFCFKPSLSDGGRQVKNKASGTPVCYQTLGRGSCCCGEMLHDFKVDVLILDENSYSCQKTGYQSCCKRPSPLLISSSEERDMNVNNSKDGLGVEENHALSQDAQDEAYSARLGVDRTQSWSSSPCTSKMCRDRTFKQEARLRSRIPVRIGAPRNGQANKVIHSGGHGTRVSFQWDRIPRKLVVVLKNKHGLKVGEAEAPIIFTHEEKVRTFDQATGAYNPDEQYTVEIRGESAQPQSLPATSPGNSQEDDGRKIPLSERLKKYQKSKPRNIHSGTPQRAGQTAESVLSGDAKQKRQTGDIHSKQSAVSKANFDDSIKDRGLVDGSPIKKNSARDDKCITPSVVRRDLSSQPNSHAQKTQYKPLARPSPHVATDGAARQTNLISQCELFSSSSSLRTAHAQEDYLNSKEFLEPASDLDGSQERNNLTSDLIASPGPGLTQRTTDGLEQEDVVSKDHRESSNLEVRVRGLSYVPDFHCENQDEAFNSVDYISAPNNLEAFLQQEQAPSRIKTSKNQLHSEALVSRGAIRDDYDQSTPNEVQESWTHNATGQTYTDRNGIETRGGSRRSNSSKQSEYKNNLALTPLHDQFSKDESQEEPDGEFLQVIHKKVVHHYFDRLRGVSHCDDEHETQSEDVSEDEAAVQTSSTSNSHDGPEQPPNESDGESIQEVDTAVGVYFDHTPMGFKKISEGSLQANEISEKTYTIVRDQQNEKILDTDGEKISPSSDRPMNVDPDEDSLMADDIKSMKSTPNVDKKSAQKQNPVLKFGKRVMPIPASSSPVRSRQAPRPKGNLFSKLAVTSDESSTASGATVSLPGTRRVSKRGSPFGAENINESRMAKDRETGCTTSTSHCGLINTGSKNGVGQNSAAGYKNQLEKASSQKDMGIGLMPKSECSKSQEDRLSADEGYANHKPDTSQNTFHEVINKKSSLGKTNEARLYNENFEVTPPLLERENTSEQMESPRECQVSEGDNTEINQCPQDLGHTRRSPNLKQHRTKVQNSHQALPPLSNRQTGLPHRPKVKRYY